MSHEIENMKNMEKEHEHHGHHELFNSAWEKSSENYLIKGLKAGKKIGDLLEAMPGFKEAFSQDSLLNQADCCLECSDGRVKSPGIKIALAGEGILLNDEERALVIKVIREKNILITGHQGCGAAKMLHHESISDQKGYEHAQQLAADSGNRYKPVNHEEFRSPIHDERALVVDGTLRFDVAGWKNFPPQFLSSAAAFGLNDEYIAKEANALTGIALSDHGFHKRFNAANPFYIIVCAKDTEQLNHLLEIGKTAVQDFGDCVKVDGFVAPEEE